MRTIFTPRRALAAFATLAMLTAAPLAQARPASTDHADTQLNTQIADANTAAAARAQANAATYAQAQAQYTQAQTDYANAVNARLAAAAAAQAEYVRQMTAWRAAHCHGMGGPPACHAS
jgi:hypothetical protein